MRPVIAIFISTFFILSACHKEKEIQVVKGVSKELADYRKSVISDLHYELFFHIPKSLQDSIPAEVNISFQLENKTQDLLMDFKESENKILSVNINQKSTDFTFHNEHLIFNKEDLVEGKNEIHIIFTAGETSLNRNQEFLYSLFVPDRARTVFPCFDQPNLKGSYTLSLEIPLEWTAVANGKLLNEDLTSRTRILEFSKTKAIPTYLFAFVAGKFQKTTKTRGAYAVSLYHRETDSIKVQSNVDSIFNLVFHSLAWLEDYTRIKYPFAKYDLIAIPSFQYGGMEHTGATLYRASRIFLDRSATQDQYLRRANLIAHETAHMWFGDYVTMKWFDEVWLKEVFANFIADKIVQPEFPDVNHDLMFLMNHFPPSYGIDRTKGCNPINQPLDNLKDAGTVYGAIIYHKAPIVMKKLEKKISEKVLQKGLQEYLRDYAYGNADWNNLITILDNMTNHDLRKWSQIWVNEPGMPIIYPALSVDNNILSRIKIIQKDPAQLGRIWDQSLRVQFYYPNTLNSFTINMNASEKELDKAKNLGKPSCLMLNSAGLEYGYFELDDDSRSYLLDNIFFIEDPLSRGIGWITLYENFLYYKISSGTYINALVIALKNEQNDLIVSNLLKQTKVVYWTFLKPEERQKIAKTLEETLWEKIVSGKPKLKYAYYKAYENIFITENAIQKLSDIFSKNRKIKGLALSENDFIDLSFQLALRLPTKADSILHMQQQRLENPDNIDKMKFITPALSADKQIRDAFFDSLRIPSNREHEPWVETALSYLNHPIRSNQSMHYIRPGLDLLIDIQETGDIFFPLGWIQSILKGHNSKDAYYIVETFLNDNPEYPEKLKLKILQAADLLERASKMEESSGKTAEHIQ